MSSIYNPYPFSNQNIGGRPQAPSMDTMIALLGTRTMVGPEGFVHMNRPLVEGLLKHRERTVPPLCRMLATSNNWLQVLEGLYLGQKLAEAKVRNAKVLYSAASRLNHTQDPMLQTYLAGLYRALDDPAAFGPMLEMVVRHANSPNPPLLPGGYDPMEEVGGTLLQLIANRQNNRSY